LIKAPFKNKLHVFALLPNAFVFAGSLHTFSMNSERLNNLTQRREGAKKRFFSFLLFLAILRLCVKIKV